MRNFFNIVAVAFALIYSANLFAACKDTNGVSVQVLGSGGPVADDARASSGYLVWVDGKSRVLIDAGGGVVLRFAEAGASVEELDAIAFTHFHVDHSVELPAILKSAYFSSRQRELIIAGPTGNSLFPGPGEFLRALFDRRVGAYRYLSGYLGGTDGHFSLKPVAVDGSIDRPMLVYQNKMFKIEGLGVHHGIVPAVAYRISVAGKRIVFAGDARLDRPELVNFCKNADLLVAHMAISESSQDRTADKLHAKPSSIAALAKKAGVKQLVLSHFMARSLDSVQDSLNAMKKIYSGKISVSKDGECFTVTADRS